MAMAAPNLPFSKVLFDQRAGARALARASPCSSRPWRCSSESVSDTEANRPGGNPTPSESVRYRSKLERLYYCDTTVPSEVIEKPRAVSTMAVRAIGNNPPCSKCKCVGVVECATCSASGLYVEPILESQGIIVKVRCMGCGGSGSLMCPTCGGRGHV